MKEFFKDPMWPGFLFMFAVGITVMVYQVMMILTL